MANKKAPSVKQLEAREAFLERTTKTKGPAEAKNEKQVSKLTGKKFIGKR